MTARQRSGLGAKNFRSTGLALLLFSLLILSGRASFAGKTSANLDMYLESELFSVRVKASRQDWHLGLASSSESPRYAELAHRFKVSKQTDLYPNIGLGRDGNGFLSIGLAGSYLDYRIGTWALNSEWEARGGLDGFQLKIDADYSIGNLSARARGRLFQGQTGLWWESSPMPPDFWEVALQKGYLRGGSGYRHNYLYGDFERQFSVAGHSPRILTGLGSSLSMTRYDSQFFLTGRLRHEKIWIAVIADGLTFDSLLTFVKNESVALGLLVAPGQTYNILAGHLSDISSWLEVSNPVGGEAELKAAWEVEW